MKRLALVLVMVVLATAAFSLDLSAGVGAGVGYFSESETISIPALVSATVGASGIPLNFRVYFDATYVQASVGYLLMVGNSVNASGTVLGIAVPGTSVAVSGTVGSLAFAALGRYPIKLKGFTLSPLLGVEYDLNLDNSAGAVTDMNQFWIKGGVAMDFFVSKTIYIRPELLLGFAFPNQSMSDAITAAQAAGLTASALIFDAELNILVGFKF
jgi:hypothetical protein